MQKIFFYAKKYKYICFIIVFLLCFLCSFVFLNKEDKYQTTELEKKEEMVEANDLHTIQFDIKGAVKNPGVYKIRENSRVSDAIELSGGLTEVADTSVINLSKNITDEMVIVIYTKEEIEEMKKGNTSIKYIEKECICPQLKNDACIDEKVTNNDDNITNTNKVSLNKATLKELMTLTGIGESKAKLIIAYREANGGFKSIEELTKVKGIGATTYEKIKDRLTL